MDGRGFWCLGSMDWVWVWHSWVGYNALGKALAG